MGRTDTVAHDPSVADRPYHFRTRCSSEMCESDRPGSYCCNTPSDLSRAISSAA